ncbi:deoxyribose-phosphate aldolase [Fluoribacter dumoffii]|uniref:deoxyribose-phosphate aldolase n=1 Tax=Fluoribacter dumoffii TaxID=463 RepID=A0A377G9X1_9GAMM|nr:deoxyribose-phosphate aldolase [Fluoribacter dumoffii]KTC89033.1 2-deoxyribose-5-phosphate aldolase [Fluoribacter dumoffii NY 23]MCW8385759.1 deoxyribose-phosphate aldolase [Fluoribacter dumoffii]MCW8495946.1 deoxyribose-phosphate aldolase [Fluoribacter dumoffii]STO21563.1 Deoxyribose-phosphate aldolase [Fluoribacter dumoffii]
MSLEIHFNQVMQVLLGSYAHRDISAQQLIHTLDLTLLDEHATTESLSRLKNKANQNEVAALCIYLNHLDQFSCHNSIPLATVVNFPQGAEDLDSSLGSIKKAMQMGVAEIDYVFPYQQYLQGEKQKALGQCGVISKLCRQNHLTLKIILETGAFPDMKSVYTASHELIELGCDFIKTSTGKLPTGASLSAAFAILSAIKESKADCGIKVSGGIKSAHEAYSYAILSELLLNKHINKSWFRIGASSLLDELLKII